MGIADRVTPTDRVISTDRLTLRVPGDKSITQRALILGALADGDSPIRHAPRGADPLATASALAQLGVEVGYGTLVNHNSSLLTIYAGVTLAGQHGDRHRAGLSLRISPDADLRFELSHRGRGSGIAMPGDSKVLLRGSWRW